MGNMNRDSSRGDRIMDIYSRDKVGMMGPRDKVTKGKCICTSSRESISEFLITQIRAQSVGFFSNAQMPTQPQSQQHARCILIRPIFTIQFFISPLLPLLSPPHYQALL